MEGNFFNLLKGTYEKPTLNIIRDGERVDTFPLRLGEKQGCLLSPVLFNSVMKALARTIRQ